MSGGDPAVVKSALSFAEHGVPVLGVGLDKRPRLITYTQVNGKRKAVWEPRQKVAPDVETIRQEVDRASVFGFGVIMGALAGRSIGAAEAAVIDLEQAISAGRLQDAAGWHPGDTAVARSGGGGTHLYLGSGKPVGCHPIYDVVTGEHVGDIKGAGGYIIAPPSQHNSGNRYRWLTDPDVKPRVLPDLLEWFRPLADGLGWTLHEPHKLRADGEPQSPIGDLLASDCNEGGRHNTLIRLLGWARNTMSRDEALALVSLWNETRCHPSLPSQEIVDQVNDTYRRWAEPPRLITREPPDEDLETTPQLEAVPAECWRGWFKDYRDVMVPTTEATPAYHLGAALTAVGVVLGRSCWNDYARRIYPNLFTVLVGSSGRSRKDTAIDRALTAIEPPDLRAPFHNVLDTVASAEGLIERLAVKQTIIHLSEVSTLLRNARREGTSNIIPYLTKLFDCPPAVELPTRKNAIRAEKPFLSILGATTPEWFDRDVTEEDMHGGFIGRFMFFVGEPGATLADPPPVDNARLRRLQSRLYDVATMCKQRGGVGVTLSEDARKWWASFYEQETSREYLPDLAILFQRVPVFVRKIGLIYAVMEGMEEITAEHLEAAAGAVRLSQQHVSASYAQWGSSMDARLAEQMLRYVKSKGGITASRDIHQHLGGRVKAPVFSSVIGNLLRYGRLVAMSEGRVALPSYARRNGHGG
jgi:hypothetical protein